MNGVSIQTTVDNAGSGNSAAIGNSDGTAVSAVSMTLATTDAVAFKTSTAAVTFSFTTARVLPAGQRITVTLPANYFVARTNPAVTIVIVNPGQGVVAPTATCTLASVSITCVTADSALEAGAHRLVFGAGQLSTGAALVAQVNGLAISTSVDNVASGFSAAIVVHSIIFENALDLFSQKRTSGAVNISFVLQTTLPAGGSITVQLPNGFFTAVAQPVASIFCSGDVPSISCALAAASITCTTSNRNLVPGLITLRFLPSTLTTGIARDVTNELKIQTSVDAATAGSVTPAIAAGKVRMHTCCFELHISLNFFCSFMTLLKVFYRFKMSTWS